jgi:hypothetical protein
VEPSRGRPRAESDKSSASSNSLENPAMERSAGAAADGSGSDDGVLYVGFGRFGLGTGGGAG